jgi:hypothetical protein
MLQKRALNARKLIKRNQMQKMTGKRKMNASK